LDTKEDADLDITGYTEEKKQKRAILEKSCLKISKSLSLYAQMNNLSSFKEMVNFTPSDLTRMRDTEIYTTACKMEELLIPYQSQLSQYGISANDISQLSIDIKSFFDVIQSPKYKIGERSSLNSNLMKYMGDMDELLKEKMDVAMTIVGLTNNTLQNQYLSSRAIDDTGTISGIKTYQDTVSANSTRTVSDIDYEMDLTFTFLNKGNTPLVFGLSLDGVNFLGTVISVQPLDSITRDASDLAAEGMYLLVQNIGNTSGSYIVTVD
jgi:DNA polymerase II large subunit